MERTSSINFQVANSHSYYHNSRERPPTYLLPDNTDFYCDKQAKEAIKLQKEYTNQAKENYKKSTGKKLRTDTKETIEAVMNLQLRYGRFDKEVEEWLPDINNLKQYLQETYGLNAIQTAIHFDEGHAKGLITVNYHAHIVFSNFDKEGKTIFRKLDKKALRDIQDKTAKFLHMRRGVKSEESKRKHLTPAAYKQLQDERREAQKEAKKAKEAQDEANDTNKRLESEYEQKRVLNERLNKTVKVRETFMNFLGYNRTKKEVEEQKKEVDDLQMAVSESYMKILKNAGIPIDYKESNIYYWEDKIIKCISELHKQLKNAKTLENSIKVLQKDKNAINRELDRNKKLLKLSEINNSLLETENSELHRQLNRLKSELQKKQQKEQQEDKIKHQRPR